MSYTLVIVESPAKAKTIEKYLPDGCKVAATMGHIIDLPKSKLGIDIENNFQPAYQPIVGKGKLLKELSSVSKKADEVILATDPDREGEAISFHLANYLGLSLEADNRIEFHEITPNAIRTAIQQKRPINMDLVDAQQARRVLDRLVGYQISPVLWKKIMRGLSAGRVQSAATRMVVDRENEIRAFVPEEYWVLGAKLRQENSDVVFSANLTKRNGEKFEVTSTEEAQEVASAFESGEFSVSKVTLSQRKRKGPAPFITSTLQQDAYRKLYFSTKKTMMLAQQLYEGLEIAGQGNIGLITYMRTDSTRISDDAKADAKEWITNEFGKEYLGTGTVRKAKGNVQDAHEGIRPTDLALTPDTVEKSLTKDQHRLYMLIYRRFMASQMADAVYDTISSEIACKASPDAYELKASGSKLRFPGFLKMYEVEEEEELSLPQLIKGETLLLAEVVSEQKFTQPPPRYTEASLVKALEEEGIGRPSTYAPTISTILARNYVVQQDRKFMPTELGEIVVNLMSENFKNVIDLTFTANMEKELDRIAEGEENWVKVIGGFYQDLKSDLDKADSIERVKLPSTETDIICDKCGRNMVIKYGRFGRFLACPGFPECTNAMPLTNKVDAHCPLCGKEILEKKSRKGRVFYGCAGYPECSYVSWNKPTDNLCPKCGKQLFEAAKGKSLFCADKTCGYKDQQEASTS